MSKFEVLIYPVTLEPHPNADAIELAVIGDYRSIVQKDTLKNGDLVAYIPEGAIVPEWVLERLNLVGKLAGKQGNRVKAIRLRGIVSQGLCFPLEYREHVFDQLEKEFQDIWIIQHERVGAGRSFNIGDDAQEFLGITKYEPVIPTHMGGEVFNAFGYTPKYDIENWKRWLDVIEDGEEVVFTEKLHGTWACFGYHPEVTHPIVTSKGLSDRGLAFKFNDANQHNLYIKAFNKTADFHDSGEDCVTVCRRAYPGVTPFYILGEIFGVGVQDLHYGIGAPQFRAFDIYLGEPGSGKYADWDVFESMCEILDIPTVPVLYRGPFSIEAMRLHTDGREVVSGTEACIREGIVMKPTVERRDALLGRVVLKSVSDAYLTRKGTTTEYN